MSHGTIAAVRTRCGVNVPLVGGVDRSLSDGQPFSHPPSEGGCGRAARRGRREVLREHLGEFADGQVFAQGSEVAVKFNVVRGGFPHLAGADTDDAVVGMQKFPSTGVQSQLKVFKQAAHVAQACGSRVRAPNGLQITNDDQALRWSRCIVQRERRLVVCITQDALINEHGTEGIGKDHNVHAVGVTEQTETRRFISLTGVEQNGTLALNPGRPFHRHGSGVLKRKISVQQSGETAAGRQFDFTVLMSLP